MKMLTITFYMSSYLNKRVELFHSIVFYHPLSLRMLLFGDQNLSTEDNFIIFRAVHRFIYKKKKKDLTYDHFSLNINTSGTLSCRATRSPHHIYLFILNYYF